MPARDRFGIRLVERFAHQKAPLLRGFLDAPDRIRTCDLRFRRPTLYPAELRAPVRPRIATGSGSSRFGAEAERAGFEPAMGFKPHTRLAGECLQPLGHLSRGERLSVTAIRPG